MSGKKLTPYRKLRGKKGNAAAVVRFDPEAYFKADALCEETGIPMSGMITMLVNYACDNVEIRDATERPELNQDQGDL